MVVDAAPIFVHTHASWLNTKPEGFEGRIRVTYELRQEANSLFSFAAFSGPRPNPSTKIEFKYQVAEH